MQVLDVIPANLIDAAFNSGVANATPPPPAPVASAATARSATKAWKNSSRVKPPDKLSHRTV